MMNWSLEILKYLKKWGARYTFCKGDQQCNDSRHKYGGDQSYWLLAEVAIARKAILCDIRFLRSSKSPVNEPVGVRQQYPWGWEFTFHTVLQCFCNLYYSTCFWAEWFTRMKCYGQQVMNDDDWWWMMVNTPRKKRMFVRWWGDVQHKMYNILP